MTLLQPQAGPIPVPVPMDCSSISMVRTAARCCWMLTWSAVPRRVAKRVTSLLT